MLWFPLMVNENRIGTVEIVRRCDEGGCDRSRDSGRIFTYDWKITRQPKLIEEVLADEAGVKLQPDLLGSGELKHAYADGAWELVRKVMDAYARHT